MDPNEALVIAMMAMWRGIHADADDALTDLQEWMARGGFAPNMATVRRRLNERMAEEV